MAVKKFTVHTYINGVEVDRQAVNSMSDLADNAFVEFDREQELSANAGIEFSGGTDGEATGTTHAEARDAFESYSFNILLAATADEDEQNAYIEYTKRLRDEYGVKFQTVVPQIERENKINHEGIIEVGTTIADSDFNPYDIVYFVAGAEAGCRVQDSCVAKKYTGSFTVNANVNRAQMEEAIENGTLIFHKDGSDVVILKDINTLTDIEDSNKENKHDDMRQNQTIRVLDTICVESAKVFNGMFLGKFPNDEVSRAELRNQLLKIRKELAQIRAIAPYDEANLNIIAGKDDVSVIGYDAIRPLNCMEKLYLNIGFLNF